MLKSTWKSGIVSVVLCAGSASAQYVIDPDQSETLPDIAIEADKMLMPISPNRLDVRALGMGKTLVAGGQRYNAMSANPALLAAPAKRFELIGVAASIPSSTLGAAMFVKDNADEFKGGFLTDINTAYTDFKSAANLQDSLAALRDLREALIFPNDVRKKLADQVHGLAIIPDVTAQWNNWGASIHGTGQMGFMVQTGNTLDQLLTVEIPEEGADLDLEAIRTLESALDGLFDENGNPDPAALPEVFAIAYMDIVGTIGYGRKIRPNLDMGVAMKIINRRFSAKNISAAALADGVLGESISELQASVTGVTADLGAVYTLKNGRTRIGVSAQNIIPLSALTSVPKFRFLEKEYYYTDDGFGQPDVDVNGDTILAVESQYHDITLPIEMTAPLLVNMGIQHPVNPKWDVAAEWADLLGQDDKYEKGWHRLRVGIEYRPMGNLLALRTGLSDGNFSLGAGVGLWLAKLDVAYAYDNFIGDNSFFAQAKIGF